MVSSRFTCQAASAQHICVPVSVFVLLLLPVFFVLPVSTPAACLLRASLLFAGFVSAGLFRSPRGPKAAAIAGAVGALAAGGLAAAREYFPSL